MRTDFDHYRFELIATPYGWHLKLSASFSNHCDSETTITPFIGFRAPSLLGTSEDMRAYEIVTCTSRSTAFLTCFIASSALPGSTSPSTISPKMLDATASFSVVSSTLLRFARAFPMFRISAVVVWSALNLARRSSCVSLRRVSLLHLMLHSFRSSKPLMAASW